MSCNCSVVELHTQTKHQKNIAREVPPLATALWCRVAGLDDFKIFIDKATLRPKPNFTGIYGGLLVF